MYKQASIQQVFNIEILLLFFSNCWRSWQSFPSRLNLWKFPFFLSLHSLYTPSSLPWQWCYSESPPHLPPPQHRQEGTRERGRERQGDIYRERERERERETEEEKGLCFPGNRLGVSPTPIGSQLVGISLLPRMLGANRVSVSRLSLSSLFCSVSSHACAHKHTQVLVKIQSMLIHNQKIKHQSTTGSYLFFLFCLAFIADRKDWICSCFSEQMWCSLQHFFLKLQPCWKITSPWEKTEIV